MMPSLVSHKRLGTLSGIGWAAGYVGGLVSLVLVAGFIVADPDTGKTLLGLNPIMPVDAATRADERLVGPFSALWYLIFVLPLFLFTPDRPGTRAAAPVKAGITQLFSGAKDLYLHHRQVALFLLARMLYADGLGAVFAFGGIYAASVFGWGASELGLFGIILTLAGTIGAALGGALDDRLGSKRVIGWALLPVHSRRRSACSRSTRPTCCSCMPSSPRCRAAHRSPRLASRSISPSPFSSGLPRARSRRRAARCLARLSPPEKTTEFFGFFSFSGKITAFAAPLAIGAVTAATGSQRLGIGTSLLFLIAGLLLLAAGEGESLRLMPEVAHAGEHHGESRLVGGRDHLGVAHRPSRLDHRGGAGRGDRLQPVREGKERI